MAKQTNLGIGLDVGSTTTKGVLIDAGGTILAKYLLSTGATAQKSTQRVLKELASTTGKSLDDLSTVSTGYGRKQVTTPHKSVTEITCHAVGVHALNKDIRTLIDVGGQDSKVIRIGSNGRPTDFELNDKCSAGTGRFLEVMARVLEISIEELGPLALKAKEPCSISSTCTVFAESEVIGHIGEGNAPADIAAGIHEAMAAKIASLTRRVGIESPVGLTGGVALNPAFQSSLSKQLDTPLWLPDIPQYTGAYGAALLALKHLNE